MAEQQTYEFVEVKAADILADRNRGSEYYLAEVKAGTVAFTDAPTPGEWKNASADAAE